MESWKQGEQLSTHTTFKVGGPAEYFALVHSEAELAENIAAARAESIPVTILGGGSNVLIADEGVQGLVIKNALTGIVVEEEGSDVYVTAGAGEVFDDVVAYTVVHGYWGIENLSHIPGSIGATPVQNVGAYGVEIGEYIHSVRVYDTKNDTMIDLAPTDCAFGYRDSIFKHADGQHYIVLAVTLKLTTIPSPKLSYRDLATYFEGKTPNIAEIRDAVIEIRSKKFPDWHRVGTAGSFFKNPVISNEAYTALLAEYPELPGFPSGTEHTKVPLGWILDKVCNLRGVSEGKVGTYEGQALVLINQDGATAREIEAFAQTIAARVHEATNISIEWEVTKVGEWK